MLRLAQGRVGAELARRPIPAHARDSGARVLRPRGTERERERERSAEPTAELTAGMALEVVIVV